VPSNPERFLEIAQEASDIAITQPIIVVGCECGPTLIGGIELDKAQEASKQLRKDMIGCKNFKRYEKIVAMAYELLAQPNIDQVALAPSWVIEPKSDRERVVWHLEKMWVGKFMGKELMMFNKIRARYNLPQFDLCVFTTYISKVKL
jgi:hypothetical protein